MPKLWCIHPWAFGWEMGQHKPHLSNWPSSISGRPFILLECARETTRECAHNVVKKSLQNATRRSSLSKFFLGKIRASSLEASANAWNILGKLKLVNTMVANALVLYISRGWSQYKDAILPVYYFHLKVKTFSWLSYLYIKNIPTSKDSLYIEKVKKGQGLLWDICRKCVNAWNWCLKS